MQEWIKSLRIKGINMQCESLIDGIVEDNTRVQGYESRSGDFDICVPCLMKFKDKTSFKDLYPFKRAAFKNSLAVDRNEKTSAEIEDKDGDGIADDHSVDQHDDHEHYKLVDSNHDGIPDG
jgi:hypothetical protein